MTNKKAIKWLKLEEILIYDWSNSLAYGFSTICNGENSIYIYS